MSIRPSKRTRLRRARQSARRAAAYRLVDLRDRGRCRVCGDTSGPMHHHHIRYRSLGGADSSANVALVCARCHADIHAARVRLSGDADVRDADGLLSGLQIAYRPPEGWS
jgi:5-methylcytosine-specific restriction endonuclease McrA